MSSHMRIEFQIIGRFSMKLASSSFSTSWCGWQHFPELMLVRSIHYIKSGGSIYLQSRLTQICDLDQSQMISVLLPLLMPAREPESSFKDHRTYFVDKWRYIAGEWHFLRQDPWKLIELCDLNSVIPSKILTFQPPFFCSKAEVFTHHPAHFDLLSFSNRL